MATVMTIWFGISAIYQHIALDGQLEERYQKAMREVEI
jgi:hypothetical protein